MQNWLYVALGGALGAVLRYAVVLSLSSYTTPVPYATLLINVLGCAIIGYMGAYFQEHANETLRHLLTIGILGAFTTFSTFAFESYQLYQKDWVYAVLNIALHNGLGGLAVVLGYKLYFF
jgi:fluoride exporter